MKLKYILIFILILLLLNIFLNWNKINSNSSVNFIDISNQINCDISTTWYNKSEFVKISSQEDLDLLNCTISSSAKNINFNQGIIVGKGHFVAANDRMDLVEIKIKNINTTSITFSIYEPKNVGGVDLYPVKEFYIYIPYEELKNREIIFE